MATSRSRSVPAARAVAACGRIEKPFRGQLPLQLLERQLQRAVTLRLKRLHDQLQFAARSYRSMRPRASTATPSCGLNFR